jgi:hypothetical protein
MRTILALSLLLAVPITASAESSMTTDPATGDQRTSVRNGGNAADVTQGGGAGNSANVIQSGGATATVTQHGNGNVAIIRQSGRSTVTSTQGDGPPVATVNQDGSAGQVSVTQSTR